LFGFHEMNSDRSDSEDEGGQSGDGDNEIGRIVHTFPAIVDRLQQSLGSESSGVPNSQKASTGRGRPKFTYKKPAHIPQETWNAYTHEEKQIEKVKNKQKKPATCSKRQAAVLATQPIQRFLVQPAQEAVAAVVGKQVLPYFVQHMLQSCVCVFLCISRKRPGYHILENVQHLRK
jgi:hypothetical protein